MAFLFIIGIFGKGGRRELTCPRRWNSTVNLTADAYTAKRSGMTRADVKAGVAKTGAGKRLRKYHHLPPKHRIISCPTQ
jgi:hypothetical protein